MTHNPTYQPGPEAQWQAARSAGGPTPATQSSPASGPAAPEGAEAKGGRPSNLMLAGTGSLLAVLAFLRLSPR